MIQSLLAELRTGLTRYWEIADAVLGQTGIRLKTPGDDFFSFRRNFFSLLFLYSFHRAQIPQPRRILYAAILQCLRGMVTGCDNLLDDEYKTTLATDLPQSAIRFRSVMDIMVSDRVLFELLLDTCRRGEIDMGQVAAAATASMKTMTQSGIQEASEEAGVTEILSPDAILKSVHHFKTGILFTCPWDIPGCLERIPASETAPLRESLYRIGMGCQILDDMVDVASDLERKRHNYLIALIHHGGAVAEKRRLQALLSRESLPANPADAFPENLKAAYDTARDFLESGFSLLYPEAYRFLVGPSIQFLEMRIGTAQLLRDAES